jgi:hypothetical protein
MSILKIRDKDGGIISLPFMTNASGKIIIKGEGISAIQQTGSDNQATGDFASALGQDNKAVGIASSARGSQTKAEGEASSTKGILTKATGKAAVAKGYKTLAEGNYSVAKGIETKTKENATAGQAQGKGTIVGSKYQNVQGRYNIVDDEGEYAHIVGNGEDDSHRSNAYTLDWEGNARFNGDVYAGGSQKEDGNSKKLATEDYVDKSVEDINNNIIATGTTHSGAYRVSKSGTNTLTLNDVDKPEHNMTVSAIKPASIDFSGIKRALEEAGYTCEEIENGFIINGTNTNSDDVLGMALPTVEDGVTYRVRLYCDDSNFSQNLLLMHGDGEWFEPSSEPKYVKNITPLNLNIYAEERITLNDAKLIFSVEKIMPNITFKVYGNSSEYTKYITDENGQAIVKSIYPYMQMVTTTSGVNLAAEYNKDLSKAFDELKDEQDTKIEKSKLLFTNALKDEASGEIISVNDVSPIEHEMKVKASSKNLIPYPYFNANLIINGVSVTDNGDGSLTLNGTSTGNVNIYLTDNNTFFLPPGTYYGSLGISNTNILFCIGGGNSELTDMTTIDNKVFTMTTYGTIGRCMIQGKSGVTYDNVTIYPQIEKGTVATEYTPYVADVSGAKLLKQGKNLFSYVNWCNYIKDNFYAEGHNYAPNESITHLEEDCFSFVVMQPVGGDVKFEDMRFKENTQYTFSFEYDFKYSNTSYTVNPFKISYTDGTLTSIGSNDKEQGKFRKVNFTSAANKTIKEIWVPKLSAGCRVYIKKNMQIEEGEATEYEPYIESIEYPITADGTVEGVTSIYPSTTLYSDTKGVLVEAEYNRDINKVCANQQAQIDELKAMMLNLITK